MVNVFITELAKLAAQAATQLLGFLIGPLAARAQIVLAFNFRLKFALKGER
ncbi:MAG: hypothetical protein CM15mV144_310 [Caudoviricetes sp.]|nr:MAG: hypothetical protein CM15mV144_310 [Caudoviricetes sp.]